ncbi:MAG: hypothetical protein H7175_19765 [Burkholderiales bacterium]|nr:hypothetical protein [Anaerolineae bacterium]
MGRIVKGIRAALLLLVITAAVGCDLTAPLVGTPVPLPTLMVLPTLTISVTSTVTLEVLPTETLPTEIPSAAPTDVIGFLPTVTPLPTSIPPTSTLALPTVPAVPTAIAALPPTAPADRTTIMINRLRTTPLVINTNTQQIHDIFRRGQELGNRANVFSMVGDSNTTNGDFMLPIGLYNLCDLGPYDYLQETIDHYSVSPREDVTNSFTNQSMAAERGFSAAIVLDPFWADGLCQSNETPLMCEYRRVQPSVSIIMLGQIDINYGNRDIGLYRAHMERIVQDTIDRGVIPVLTTIIFLESRDVWSLSMEFNMVLLDLAETYQIPLINMWAAAETLPDHGIGPDHSHLKAVIGRYCSFDGSEYELGGTLRNLLTLQALDEVRRNVLTTN